MVDRVKIRRKTGPTGAVTETESKRARTLGQMTESERKQALSKAKTALGQMTERERKRAVGQLTERESKRSPTGGALGQVSDKEARALKESKPRKKTVFDAFKKAAGTLSGEDTRRRVREATE